METDKQRPAEVAATPVSQQGKDILDDPYKTRLFITRLRARIATGASPGEHERLSRLLRELESWLARQP